MKIKFAGANVAKILRSRNSMAMQHGIHNTQVHVSGAVVYGVGESQESSRMRSPKQLPANTVPTSIMLAQSIHEGSDVLTLPKLRIKGSSVI